MSWLQHHPNKTLARDSSEDASWVLIAIGAIFVAGFQLADPFSFQLASISFAMTVWFTLYIANRFYTYIRPKPEIAAMMIALLQMLIFSSFGAALSYMVGAHGGAYWDKEFRAWDAALGFDWLEYIQWVNTYPALGKLYHIAYISLIPQMVLLIIALGFSGRIHTLRIAVFAAIMTGFVTVLLSGIMPGMSNFIALGLSQTDYPNLNPAAAVVHFADLEALRSGALRHIALNRLEGIITFPSYHAGLATVFAWAYLKAPIVRWPGFFLSVLTILATPIDGAHYLVDVLGGMTLAGLSITIAYYCVPLSIRFPSFKLQSRLATARTIKP
jgi:membrane-associated phospholipid phosphatase